MNKERSFDRSFYSIAIVTLTAANAKMYLVHRQASNAGSSIDRSRALAYFFVVSY